MENATSSQELSVHVNNITISYNDVGIGKIPVIFLHGFPFDKSTWNGQLDFLKSSNRVLSYDIRGFGRSTDEDTPLSMDLFGADLLSFMDQLKIDKAIVCGLSMGGYIALNAVKRFPDRFVGLILCDTQCIADTAEGKVNRYKTIDQINLNGTEEYVEKFISNVFHPYTLQNEKGIVENLRSVLLSNSKEIITHGLAALAERSETCSTLGDIQIPTLIICGEEDKVTPLAQSQFMHDHIEGSILRIIEKAGHVSNLEKPNDFNRHLLDFLNTFNKISS